VAEAGVLRIDLNRDVEFGDGTVVVALHGPRVPALKVGGGQLGIELQRPVEIGEGRVIFLSVIVHRGSAAIGDRAFRVESNRLGVVARRMREFFLFTPDGAAHLEREGVFGVIAHALCEEVDGLIDRYDLIRWGRASQTSSLGLEPKRGAFGPFNPVDERRRPEPAVSLVWVAELEIDGSRHNAFPHPAFVRSGEASVRNRR
jgi:hypothetical protein